MASRISLSLALSPIFITTSPSLCLILLLVLLYTEEMKTKKNACRENLIKIKLHIFVVVSVCEIETFKLMSYFSYIFITITMMRMMGICVYEWEHIMSKHTKKSSSSCHPFSLCSFICVSEFMIINVMYEQMLWKCKLNFSCSFIQTAKNAYLLQYIVIAIFFPRQEQWNLFWCLRGTHRVSH